MYVVYRFYIFFYVNIWRCVAFLQGLKRKEESKSLRLFLSIVNPTAPMRAGYYTQLCGGAPQQRIISHWRNGV